MIEYSGNHATLFYTSTMASGGVNYTFVNTVDILRFTPTQNNTYYRTETNINRYRDSSNDTVNLG